MHRNTSWRKLLRIARYISGLHIPVYASHAGFFIVLAVFPLLVLLLSLLRYTGLEVAYLTELLHGILPVALMPAAQRLILNTYNSTSGTLVSVSAVAVLWSASRGIHGLVTGLNAIYGVTEKRGYFQNRLISVVYTVLFLLVLLLTLVLAVFGESISAWLFSGDSLLFDFLENIVDFRFFLLLFLQTALFCAMYMVLPSRANTLSDSFPGAVLASVGWLVFSDLYSVYVERFAGLSNVYGSVYSVALSMLWLYCCVSIVFYGGALNQWLMQKENKV